jgi:4-alpha-glucanotransferase
VVEKVLPSQDVLDLAKAFRVATEYTDDTGTVIKVSGATVEKVLAALGVDVKTPEGLASAWDRVSNGPWRKVLPSVVVSTQGIEKLFPVHVPDGSAVVVWVELEEGGRVPVGQIDNYVPPRSVDGSMVGEATFAVPTNLPLGWHTLHATIEGDATHKAVQSSSTLVVTPKVLQLPQGMRGKRTWGLMAQIYATRSKESWGLGDLHDLATLGSWGGKQGAGFVLVNPMHAAEVSAPMAPSPYLPATRRYFNPIYLHIEDVPEYANLKSRTKAKIEKLSEPLLKLNNNADLLDRDRVWTAKKEALEILLDDKLSASRQAAFDKYAANEGDGLRLFATWCAFAEKYGISISNWPEGIRTPESSDMKKFSEKFAKRINFYAKLQWLIDEQFARAQAAARESGMVAGVVHDLAVGVHPEGADAWALHSVLAQGINVGCPPDLFNQLGQDWSQPPWRPDALVDAAFKPFRDMLRTILRHSGGIRVDHALGLFRLWWIPQDGGAKDGTYVWYDHEAMVGILALEAQRVGAFVVAEDLGTLEPWILDYLVEREIMGTNIAWFEYDKDGNPKSPEDWRELSMATVSVHDIPPAAGFMDGEHIRIKEDLNLFTSDSAPFWADHRANMTKWETFLRSYGYVEETAWSRPLSTQAKIEGMHRVLAHTKARLLGVSVPDIVGDVRAQNQPGTDQEYPNWRVPTCYGDGTPLLLEDFTDKSATVDLANRIFAAITHRRHW